MSAPRPGDDPPQRRLVALALALTLALVLATLSACGPGVEATCSTDTDCGCAEDCFDGPRSAIPQAPSASAAL